MNDMNLETLQATIARKAVAHLSPQLFERANRLLVSKAISEFAHELLLDPRAGEKQALTMDYQIDVPGSDIRYAFRARRMALDHWHVDPQSIMCHQAGTSASPDAITFVIQFADALGIGAAMLPVYLEELSSILYAAVWKMSAKPHRAADLARADFQTIETGMTEGHPVFVANSGRIGFDGADFAAYAPEAAAPMPLVWIAVRRDQAQFRAVEGLDYDRLIDEELGRDVRAGFEAIIMRAAKRPADYFLMPVHPWQWLNRIAIGFAALIARGDIIHLGSSPDRYQPQQAIRTFFNASNPGKRYVKMALSILNMGFELMRGLSPEDMATAPAFNDWIARTLADDPVLAALGFTLIREVATLSYRNPYFEAALPGRSGYKGMLAALWRDSPVGLIGPGERLMTMAALLHRDTIGAPLVGALISASGLNADEWIRRYLRAYFTPILHCLYAHDIIFMPHGENVILVLADHAPVRIIMKDLAEEIRILTDGEGLPPEVRRNSAEPADDMRLDGIFTDVFDCYFRHLAALLDEAGLLPETGFWSLVAECVETYQAGQPGLGDKFARFDLFADSFPRNCINRLQLRDNRQLIDPTDPNKGFRFVGRLTNPISGLRRGAAPGR